MRTVAPAISAFGPLHGRQAPLSGRQQTPRASEPAAQRPFRTWGAPQGTPGNPNSARQTPFLSVADCARPAAPDRASVRIDCIKATCVQSSGCCSKPTAAGCRRDHPGRGRGSSGSMHTIAPAISAFGPLHGRQVPPPDRHGPHGVRVGRSAALRGPSEPAGVLQVPPEIRIVPINAGPSAYSRTSNNNSTPALRRRRDDVAPSGTSRRRLRRSEHRRCSFLSQGGVPGTPEQATQGHSDTPTGTPLPAPHSHCTHRQIDYHPAILTVTGSDHRTTPRWLVAKWVAFTGIRSH